MGYQERTDLAKLRRTKAQLPVQPVYYPYVDSKNLEVLSAELGFGRMHHRPNIKDALKDINRPQCSNRCSEEAYTLAYDFCREKGQGLWPDTYGRTWPSWLNDSELIVNSVAHFLSLDANRQRAKWRKECQKNEACSKISGALVTRNITPEEFTTNTHSRGRCAIQGQHYKEHIESHIQKAKLRKSDKCLAWWKAQCRFRGLLPDGTRLDLAKSLVGHEEDPIKDLDQIFDREIGVEHCPDILGVWSGLSCTCTVDFDFKCWLYSRTKTFFLHLYCKLPPTFIFEESNFALSIKAECVSGNEVKLKNIPRITQVDPFSFPFDVSFDDIQLEQASRPINYFFVIIRLERKSKHSDWELIASRKSSLLTISE